MCSARCLCRRRRFYSCSRRLYVVRRLTVQSEATVATAFTIARRRDGWRAAHMAAAAAARLHSQKQRFIRRRRSHHCPLLTVVVAVVGLVKRSCSKPHCAAAAPRAAAVARALKRMNEGLCTILSLEPAAHFLRSQQHSSQRTGSLGRFHVCTAFASSCRFHSLASLLHAHVNSMYICNRRLVCMI